MGSLMSLFFRHVHPVERTISHLREDLIKGFSGQKLLILGRPGCGKSSLVNSFNYVINLTDPQADYEEIAQVGASTGETKTRKLTKYDHTKSMYAKLGRDLRKMAPAFFDLVGLPNQGTLSDLISKLVDGKIEDETDMLMAVSKNDSSYRDNLGREYRKPQKKMAAWTIIFVLSINEEFPEGLANDIKEAISMIGDKNERSGELRIFAFVTKSDSFREDRREDKMADIAEKFREIMSVPIYRVVKVVNFTDDDYCAASTKFLPDRDKQLSILRAFSLIFSGTNCLDPQIV